MQSVVPSKWHSGIRFVLALVAVYFVVLLRTAWLSDDAAITFRTVLNLLHGYGATFNIDERVQAYTHPLWFWVLTALTAVFQNVFYVTFVACIAISVVAVGLLLFRASSNRYLVVLLGLTVILSKAFVDFSTSGLENPLSNLLLFAAVALAAACTEGGRNRLTAFLLVCAAIYLNRPDMLLTVLPLVIYVVLPALREPKQLILAAAIAAAPVVLWTAFSLFYYGFPFPNTAYAKLGSGVGFVPRVLQGFRYFGHTGITDPLTLFAIVVGVVFGLYGSRMSTMLSLGVILYLLYVVYIGGDFMAGRFFASPFYLSLIIIAREASAKRVRIPWFLATAILGARTFYPNILAGDSFSHRWINSFGIADERGFYFHWYGLFNAIPETYARPRWHVEAREVIVTCGGLGFDAINRGPGTHMIDTCGLTDPLLARLPAKEDPHWRIGHFYRRLPMNYEESIRTGENLLVDPKTRTYWDSIRTVTRGPLFDKHRFVEIARLNLGLVEKPDWDLYYK